MKKFTDKGESLSHYTYNRIIICPKCTTPIDYFYGAKITCVHCGYNNYLLHSTSNHDLKHPEQRDFLEVDCCGQRLWAANVAHLDVLEEYIAADLRERTPNHNRSLASRLPQWMKSKKNREAILKGIAKLRKMLADSDYRPITPPTNGV